MKAKEIFGIWNDATKDSLNDPILNIMCNEISEANGAILEIAAGINGGCIPGVHYRKNKSQIILNDISFNVISNLKKYFKIKGIRNIHPMLFDIRKMPLKTGSVCVASSHLGLTNVGKADKAILELSKTLKPKGKLVLLELIIDIDGWSKLPDNYRIKNEYYFPYLVCGWKTIIEDNGFYINKYDKGPLNRLHPNVSRHSKIGALYNVQLYGTYEYIVATNS